MHRRLIILGLLLSGPLSGYRLHQVVTAHGELYRDLKKANVYYLLARMETEGLVTVQAEAGARGPRRERLTYSITEAGRASFQELLREVLQDYEPVHTGVEVATALLHHLSPVEARAILERRREIVRAHRVRVVAELGDVEPGAAGDHIVVMIDAELHWLQRALDRLSVSGDASAHATPN